MVIRYTDSQVGCMLRVACRTIAETDALATLIKEDSWELESMAHGKTWINDKVLRYLGLERDGKAFLWRMQ